MKAAPGKDVGAELQAVFREAQRAHLAGDMGRAAELYRVVEQAIPAQPHVAGRVALLAWHMRKHDVGMRLMAWYLDRVGKADADAWYNFGKFHQDSGKVAEAIKLYQHALLLQPAMVAALSNLGLCYLEVGDPEGARVIFDEALRHDDGGSAEARFNRSFVKLYQGDFEGWKDYEARMQCASFAWSHERSDLEGPDWKGEALWPGARLLVHAEQGFGDVIQFARFVRVVQSMVGPDVCVELEVPQELRRLFVKAYPDLVIHSRGIPVPPFDCKVSILSLPAVCGVTLDTIPPPVPFAFGDGRFSREAVVDGDDRPRIGIAWAGSKLHPADHKRSWPDELVRLLFESVPNVRWFSLQVGHREEQLLAGEPLELAEGATFLAAGKTYRDFSDSASMMEHLDLVVCVDTAVGHLAGSLGVPTLLCLQEPSEWRWMQSRTDSPWYPSVSIVRQPKGGDWLSVIDRVALAIQSAAPELEEAA